MNTQLTEMENGSVKATKKGEQMMPPKRGRIMMKIFEDLFKSIITVASKTGGGFGKGKSEETGGAGTGAGGSSASTTPPTSAYTSDGQSDI